MGKRSNGLRRRQRLRHVKVAELCLRRRKSGRGFAYDDAEGRVVRDRKVLQRIRALAIPPAWTEVCIADDPQAHIQAVGRDSEGRLQYRYHDDWTTVRDRRKARSLLRFGKVLPKVRAQIGRDLKRPKTERRSTAAAAGRLIDRALIRSGHTGTEDGGRGAATLLKGDVKLNGSTVSLSFTGKSGKQIQKTIRDPVLLKRLRKMKRIGRTRLFVFRDDNKRRHRLSARELNAYLREAAEHSISAKDFRTFAASAKALQALCRGKAPHSATARRRVVAAVMRETAELLGNTPAVARSSYVHPLIVEAYESDRLGPTLLKKPARKGLSQPETALLRILEEDVT
jgi:DNA topoisomerase-1